MFRWIIASLILLHRNDSTVFWHPSRWRHRGPIRGWAGNWGAPGLEGALPAAVGFCTRRDSETVMACARFRCNRLGMFWTGVRWVLVGFRVRSGCRWRDGSLVYQFSYHEFWWSGMRFISVRFTWADSARHETTGNQLAKCSRHEIRACPPWVLINAWLQWVKETINIIISLCITCLTWFWCSWMQQLCVFAACTCCTIRGTSLSNKSALLYRFHEATCNSV